MSKIQIQDVTLEVIGNKIKLEYPDTYDVSLNSKEFIGTRNGTLTTSSLAHQIDQVEKSGNGPWNK